MERAKIVVIGGGIVGLAVAAELAEKNEGVFVFEKNARLGQEVSSHNSGVIHSGIHYPKDSLKSRLCVEGNPIIYEICRKYGIPFKNLGKLTVANTVEEIGAIEHLRKQGEEKGIENLRIMGKDEIRKMEKNVDAEMALLSPSSGILEPTDLLGYFRARAENSGAVIAMGTEVTAISSGPNGFELSGMSSGEKFSLVAEVVVNSAGLYSDRIASMVGLNVDDLGYRIHYCKGDYFRIVGEPPVNRLIYPVPDRIGLGIHLTPDLSGSIRMGPNAYYVDGIDYEVRTNQEEFRRGVRGYMPSIDVMSIQEDSSGIRPKIQGPNDSFKDFIIRNEEKNGFPGLVNLIGIESPGLTSAPAIARLVSEIHEKEIR